MPEFARILVFDLNIGEAAILTQVEVWSLLF
jgi:hypothetical protein